MYMSFVVVVLLESVLAETPLNESLSEAEVKAKNYYASCMDPNKLIENLGPNPLVEMVRDIFGGWTVGGTDPSTGGDWKSNDWNFQQTLETVHDLGLSNFFSIWVGEDEKMPTQNIMQVHFI